MTEKLIQLNEANYNDLASLIPNFKNRFVLCAIMKLLVFIRKD